MKRNYLMFLIFLLISTIIINSNLKSESDTKKSSSSSSFDSLSKDKNPLSKMSDEELEKMMKDYGLEDKDMGILSSGVKNGDKKKKSLIDDDPFTSLLEIDGKKKSTPNDLKIKDIYSKNKDILSSFELNSRDAYNLVSLISNYKIFNKLPLTAMNIVKEVQSKESYEKIDIQNGKNGMKSVDINILISNSLNSQVFIDHENKVGRKGMLSLIDKNTSLVNNVWAVLNSKVFCLYKSSNYLNIIKIFRTSMLKIRDSIFSPCFFVYYDDAENKLEGNIIINNNNNYINQKNKDDLNTKKNNIENNKLNNFSNSQSLVCALNYREKEYWIKLINYHQQQQYKN